MLRGALESGLMRKLLRRAASCVFPLGVGTGAAAATLSMSVPSAAIAAAAALMFAGISWLPTAEVVFVLWVGKLAKYLVYAWLASRLPERALQRGQRHADALRAMLDRAMSNTPAPRNDDPSSGMLR